jgi:hypothetical protein
MTLVAQWLVLVLLSATPLPAAAQPAEGPERDSARTFLVVRIADALQLSDSQALTVSAVIRRSDERRLALIKQREDLERALRSVLAKTPHDPDELSKLIRDGNELDQRLALVPEETFGELQKTLTVEQQAKLLLFRRELQGEVRRAMQRRVGSTTAGSGRRNKRGKPTASE